MEYSYVKLEVKEKIEMDGKATQKDIWINIS
jgi:hypothetical protein